MNRNIKIIVALVLSFVGAVGSAWAEGVAKFNVATYNIRQLNEDDDAEGNGWTRRCPKVADLIKFHDFNIFGTQEGFKSQLEDLKAQLPGYDYIGVARDDGKEEGEHSAIFYDTNMFDLLDHGDFWLSEHPEKPGLGWDAACVRICTWGKFRHKETGRVFQFYNLHLDHVGKKAREESVLLVQKIMKEKGLNLPTFLTGDFNVDQRDRLYGVLGESDFLKDAYKKSGMVYELNGTWNDYKTDDFTDSRIDHIFVTDNVDVKRYGILTDTYRTSRADDEKKGYVKAPAAGAGKVSDYIVRIPSDHYPVEVAVEIR